MSQNFQFVKAINCLILNVNEKRGQSLPNAGDIDDEQENENPSVTYGQNQICKNICSLIEKQSFSLRQIDELVFQYQKSRNW